MNQVLLFLVLVGVVQGQDYWNNLRCRSCERAESFDRCNQYKICLDNEACYMDKIIDGTRILFNGGCRSKAVCIASGKKRRHSSSLEKREDLIACSRCCDGTDYCNDHLCGIKPVTNNTLCNSCDGRDGRPHPPQYPEDCAYLRACEPDQACFSSMIMHDEKTLRHYTTCESLKTCQHLNEFILQSYKQADPVVGKRDVGTICAVCCGDNFCNKYACETTKKRLKYLDAQHRFNHTTLREIPFFG